MPEPANTPLQQEEKPPPLHYDTRLPKLTFRQQLLIPIFGWIVWAVIRVLGPTIRYEVLGGQKGGHAYRPDLPPYVYAFWHRCIIAAAWYFRDRNVVLMNTTNFDGQWTRRVIERLGYQTAQGSSTRGGLRGLAVMAKRLEEGFDAAFTIDGPRGPRYIAKPGPVMLARRTGRPIILVHIGLEHAWTLKKTWDLFQVPKPYTRAVLVIAPPLEVPRNIGRELLEQKHQEMQKMLERLRDVAESWFSLSDAERQRERDFWNA
ncbi:MAG: lysophospholipid acyltransferase family protein [Bryobacteraceae bacterium]